MALHHAPPHLQPFSIVVSLTGLGIGLIKLSIKLAWSLPTHLISTCHHTPRLLTSPSRIANFPCHPSIAPLSSMPWSTCICLCIKSISVSAAGKAATTTSRPAIIWICRSPSLIQFLLLTGPQHQSLCSSLQRKEGRT